jgi:putative membrane protein
MFFIIIFLSIAGSTLSFFIANGASSLYAGFVYGLIGLASPLLLSDFLINPLFKDEVFFNTRRFTILTFVSNIILVFSLVFSSLLSATTNRTDLLVRGLFFAIGLNASLRYLGIEVLLDASLWKRTVAEFTQPILCFFNTLVFFSNFEVKIILQGAISLVVLVGASWVLLEKLNRWRGDGPELKIIPLLRSFVLAWSEEENELLEEELTKLGAVRDLLVDSMVFSDPSRNHAALIVPYIHPGPFRNVGSSKLPTFLSDEIGEKLGCETLVAHGPSTHEEDLTQNKSNRAVIDSIFSDLGVSPFHKTASPLVWAEHEDAKASCQTFGNVALITLTLHPKNYDDLPLETAKHIMEIAKAKGLEATIVDSHHSLNLDSEFEDFDVRTLVQSADKALEKALKEQKSDFSVGAARILPDEWSIDDGMGPGGIGAMVVKTGIGQTAAYIVIDANNMVYGLRDNIVKRVKEMGLDEVEVMTSDNHVVNAIGATDKGYFPIGAKTDEETIIRYTLEVVERAVARWQKCEMRHYRTEIKNLTVLGSKGLDTLSHVLEKAFNLFRRTAMIVWPVAFILTLVLLSVM